MNVMMWEHCSLDNYIFGCGKVYHANAIIITAFMYTPVHNCQFGAIAVGQ
jgi:hypothetical protein